MSDLRRALPSHPRHPVKNRRQPAEAGAASPRSGRQSLPATTAGSWEAVQDPARPVSSAASCPLVPRGRLRVSAGHGRRVACALYPPGLSALQVTTDPLDRAVAITRSPAATSLTPY
jgi:hypothetical protein